MNLKIKESRKELGWSQIELARKVGVSPLTIQFWERGVITPNTKNYQKLLAALNLPSEEE